jgi:aminoglycoside phosphotransferase
VNAPAPLAFDPGVPQRNQLLDTRALAARIDRLLGCGHPLRLTDVERVRVKYRVGRGVSQVLRVRSGEWAFLVSARSFPTGRGRPNYERAMADAVGFVRGVRPVTYAPDLETVFWSFPGDRGIDSLGLLHGPGPDLTRLVGRRCVPVLAAYAPEKAATGRCLDESGRVIAYVKVYASAESERAARTYAVCETLRASLTGEGTALRVATPLAYDPSRCAVALEAVAGTPLVVDGAAGRLPRLAGLGAALAALHSAPPPPGLPAFDRADPETLTNAAELIARVRPDVGSAARELADALAASRIDSGERVCLHGDVHGKNAIADGSGVTLLDLDQASLGPAAVDLGSVLGALRYTHCTGGLSLDTERALASDLLAGYRSVRELPPKPALAWHTAAALLGERALRTVTRLRPRGLAGLSGLIACAREELSYGS